MIAFFMNFLRMIWSIIIPDRTWHSDISLTGKTVIITGGNGGIGKETARDIAARGAKVIIACRDMVKGKEAKAEITADIEKENLFKPLIILKHMDLSSLTSVRNFATDVLKEEKYIHILINNAGVMACPQSKTEDGFEMQFGVNHLGHFLLTLLLLERLKASAPARIVTVSSALHFIGNIHFDDINLEKSYGPLKAYNQSKLANILFTRALSKRLEGSKVTAYSLHPGVINSGLGKSHIFHYMEFHLGRLGRWLYYFVTNVFLKTVKEGARTTLYCVIDETLNKESGFYYSGCRKAVPSPAARNDEDAERLWKLCEKLTGIRITSNGHDSYH